MDRGSLRSPQGVVGVKKARDLLKATQAQTRFNVNIKAVKLCNSSGRRVVGYVSSNRHASRVRKVSRSLEDCDLSEGVKRTK